MKPGPQLPAPDSRTSSCHNFLTGLLAERERFFEEVVEGVGLAKTLRYSVVSVVASGMLFGAVAGA